LKEGSSTVIIFTKNGVPINQGGDDLFDASGKKVAQLEGDKAFGPSGRYIATVVNDRLIHLATDSELNGSTFEPRSVAGFSVSNIAGITTNGDEPVFDP
jgi:hypothetical protein